MRSRHSKQPLNDDRRTIRTKKCLAIALKELILEKDYDEITIQEIIDRANVGRSTFYAHYESKEQLLIGNINFQETLMCTSKIDDDNYPMGINICYLFNHTRDHILLYKAMSGNRSIDILGNYFMEYCTGRIMEYFKRQPSFGKKDPHFLYYKAEAVSGGIIRMMFKWLSDGARVPAEEMVAYAKKLLNNFNDDEKNI